MSSLGPDVLAGTDRGVGVPRMGFVGSVALFGTFAVLLTLAAHGTALARASLTGTEPALIWFVAAGGCVFAPLLMIGGWLLYRETHSLDPSLWGSRLRLRPMESRDWLWSFGGLAAVGILTGGIVFVFGAEPGDRSMTPSFLAFAPLTPKRYWVLAAWLPFFVLNILGEELVWRGVVLPRQEAAFGGRAWLVNGVGWLLFHWVFPWPVLLALLPTTLVLPYVVQRRRNTWAGVVIHAGLNGPGFLALAFGLV